MSDQRPTRCPVCGEDGTKACVDVNGNLLTFDHEGRPPFFPPEYDKIFGRA